MAATPPSPTPLPFEYAPPPATRRRMRLRKTRLAIAVLAWLALGARLARLRLHDRARAGSAAVRGRAARAAVERRDLRRRRQDRARRAALRPVPRARALERDRARDAQRGRLDRGPALLRARGDRSGRHGPRRRRQHLDGHARPGRLDDHPAARQEPLAARRRPAERSLRRKIIESALAYQVEQHWSKQKILEEYLNTIYFGHQAYGVEAAAEVYFGVHAKNLQPHQAALLAALIQNPTANDPLPIPAGRDRAPPARARQDARAGLHRHLRVPARRLQAAAARRSARSASRPRRRRSRTTSSTTCASS